MLIAYSSLAQVSDCFHGILPVTDTKMKKSLNGEGNLKVVAGINEVNTVPAIDDTRGKIPVPGAGTCMGSANRDITVQTRSQVTITLC